MWELAFDPHQRIASQVSSAMRLVVLDCGQVIGCIGLCVRADPNSFEGGTRAGFLNMDRMF